ncbi:dienelactone hydrolase family protein [Flavisphingomonas formosensis]|uniref:dienelactone hydrolase family protein n=1 Tax=Flavisphingomonas formosensis TaxID=861534 RepID=UPI0012FC1FF1|nr:dienelactone hydrolase family protein [Sphingomonas formosensis]
MADDSLRQRAIALYDRFTHEGMDRRAFFSELSRMAGGAAAANLLLAGIAADPAAAAITAPGDPRIIAKRVRWKVAASRMLTGYRAMPSGTPAAPLPLVMVIHENRGLNPHIEDIARRFALAGFIALAPDFLSARGGTPKDEDKARGLISQLDLDRTTADAVATVAMLAKDPAGNGKVGAVGFCWGGALTDRVAIAAGDSLRAAVPYYGPAPDPTEAVKVKAAMMLHFAGLDDRVNATGRPWVEALRAAHVRYESYLYPNVNHAFNNDTAADRYNADAAKLAWDRTIRFLKTQLA